MTSPTVLLETLEGRYVENLRAASQRLTEAHSDVAKAERARDQLLRESAPVLRREKAAEVTGLSVTRIQQIIGGGA